MQNYDYCLDPMRARARAIPRDSENHLKDERPTDPKNRPILAASEGHLQKQNNRELPNIKKYTGTHSNFSTSADSRGFHLVRMRFKIRKQSAGLHTARKAALVPASFDSLSDHETPGKIEHVNNFCVSACSLSVIVISDVSSPPDYMWILLKAGCESLRVC